MTELKDKELVVLNNGYNKKHIAKEENFRTRDCSYRKNEVTENGEVGLYITLCGRGFAGVDTPIEKAEMENMCSHCMAVKP